MKTAFRLPPLVILLLLYPIFAGGDDTDIYFTRNSQSAGAPLVMLALDYRPNLGSTVCTGNDAANCQKLFREIGLAYSEDKVAFFELLRAALKKVIAPLEGVKIGLMMNHKSESNCAGPGQSGCSNGGYILSGFKPIGNSGEAATNKANFHTLLSQIPIPRGGRSHKFQGKELYFELFRYLTGQGIYNGHNGYKDFGDKCAADNLNDDSPDSCKKGDLDFPELAWDTNIENGPNYISPLVDNCSKLFVINFMFGVSQQEKDSDSAIAATKANGGMGLTGKNDNFATVIQYMHDADLADGSFGSAPDLEHLQNVTSFFFVNERQLQQANQKGYASAGGTTSAIPLTGDPERLVKSLEDVFKQVLSISTTFISAAVPVNVFNRSQSLNNVFFGIFQPETTPSWTGNAKRLQLAVNPDNNNLLVLDVTGVESISATDGHIKHTALTFWTDPAGDDVQNADTDKGEVPGKDGRSVARGGAGQKIPGFLSGSPGLSNSDAGARQVFTERPILGADAPTSRLLPLKSNLDDYDSLTAQFLWSKARQQASTGTPWSSSLLWVNASSEDKAEAAKLLKFARGIDENASTDKDDDTVRDWLMGDTMHSKPLPINYGARKTSGDDYSPAIPDVRVLIAGNDGMLHMIRNSVAPGENTTETADGREMWAFIPHRTFANLKDLSDNADAAPHPYGLDGSPVGYIEDHNSNGTIESGDKVYIYIGMRRGGKAYYALDISAPDVPKLLWRLQKTSSGDFDELGLSFSEPTIGTLAWGVDGDGDPVSKPIVIFAGGYDDKKDSEESGSGTNDSEGNAIYIVDAATGTLIWKAKKGTGTASLTVFQHPDLNDSIPSTVTAVDTTGDGNIDRLYVGDTGGVLWRADLPGSESDGSHRAQWSLANVFSAGRHVGEPDRRFFHQPLVITRVLDNSGLFDAIVIGSGDRAHPLETAVQNRLFVFKDRSIVAGAPPTSVKTPSNLADLSSNCLAAGSCNETKQIGITANSPNGWFIELAGNGEKMLATAASRLGTLFFSTYLPAGSSTSCGPVEGTGLSYILRLDNAGGVLDFDTSTDGIERFQESGSGIPSDPVYINIEGNRYITPSNIPQGRFREPLPTLPTRTYWFEMDQ